MTPENFLHRIAGTHPDIVTVEINEEVRRASSGTMIALDIVTSETAFCPDVKEAVEELLRNLRPELPAGFRVCVLSVRRAEPPRVKADVPRIRPRINGQVWPCYLCDAFTEITLDSGAHVCCKCVARELPPHTMMSIITVR